MHKYVCVCVCSSNSRGKWGKVKSLIYVLVRNTETENEDTVEKPFSNQAWRTIRDLWKK